MTDRAAAVLGSSAARTALPRGGEVGEAPLRLGEIAQQVLERAVPLGGKRLEEVDQGGEPGSAS